jgi:hypothetical protein
MIKIDVYHHFLPDNVVLTRLDVIERKTDRILRKTETIMPTLEELQAKADATLASVTAETDIDNAVAKVVTDQRQTIIDLKAQLAAAGTDPVKLQALSDTLDHILTLNTSNTQIVSDAVTAGTPAA